MRFITTWYGDLDGSELTPWQQRLLAAATAVDRIAVAAGSVAMACFALLALLTCALVVAGALFGFAHNGLEEAKWYLCGSAFLLGGALCLRENGHVRVDTIYSQLAPRRRALIDLLGLLLVLLPVCTVVVIYGGAIAWDTYARGAVSTDAGGLGARWLPRAMIPLGFLLLGLQALASAARALLTLVLPRARTAEVD